MPGMRASVGPFHPLPVQRLVTDAARRLPDKTAIIDGDRRFTFRQLDETSDRLASALAAMGAGKGTIVGVLAPNCAEFEIAFFGILKAGATVTTINSGYREREIAAQLNASGAETVIVHKSLLDVYETAARAAPGARLAIVISEGSGNDDGFWGRIKRASGPVPNPEVDVRRDLAALPFSSGTTGLSKGVMLTHANLHCDVRQISDRQGEDNVIRSDDVVLVHLPLFHIYGMTALMQCSLYAGATQVMMGRFHVDDLLGLLSRHRVTALYTAPPVCLALSQAPEVEQYDLSALRFVMSGAAPMSAELQLRLSERLGATVFQGYGLTESSPVTHMDFTDARARPGSIGPPLPDTEQRVVDMESPDVVLGPGELGELLIRGPQVMMGYYNEPAATAATIGPDGWLHTGDLVKMDEDGYVYVLDRKKELIKYSGFQVPPAELEGLLLEHPAVADAAVIGKDDDEHGEIPKAFVVPKPGEAVTADELMTYVGERVATFKRIREVEFVDSIPKNASGKLLRRVLVEQERAKGGTAG